MGGELPPVGAGLQLRGNRDDYYAPANSLLHKCDEFMVALILCEARLVGCSDKPCHGLLASCIADTSS